MNIFFQFYILRNVVFQFFKLTAQTQFIAKDTRILPFVLNYWKGISQEIGQLGGLPLEMKYNTI